MRKIYSLVLIAAALLVGTNARATIHPTQTAADEASFTTDGINFQYGTIYEAFDAVQVNVPATIKLLKNVEVVQTIFIYDTDHAINTTTDSLPTNRKIITLDLGLDTLSSSFLNCIDLMKGKLTIKADKEGNRHGAILMKHETKNTAISALPNNIKALCQEVNLTTGEISSDEIGNAIRVTGHSATHDGGTSYPCKYVKKWSELIIGANVKIIAKDDVDATHEVNGISIDAIADDYMRLACATTGYATGTNAANLKTHDATNGTNGKSKDFAQGVEVIFEDGSYLYATKYGIKINGIIAYKEGSIPYVHVKHGAELVSHPTNQKSTPIYSSGWGRFDLEGYIHGSTGVYIKGGIVHIKDATIQSDNTTAATPTQRNGESGIKAGGSAIVIDNATGYVGDQEVVISGDTKVSATAGYAVEAVITGGNEEDLVDVIQINGGTFEGGPEGTVTFDDDQTVAVTVAGGTYDDPTDITAYINTGAGATVVQTTDSAGNTVFVVSTPETPATEAVTWHENATINAETDPTWYVKLTGTNSQTLNNGTHASIAYLTMEANTSVIIKEGASLTVGEVVLNWTKDTDPSTDGNQSAYATIIVEPGGKLIATGDKGVYAPKAENLVLQANANNQALFVISKDVNSNKQPNATVQLYTTAHQVDASTWLWQRFATPMIATTTPTKSVDTPTGVMYIDNATENWIHINAWNELRVFNACAITNNTAAGGVIYTFSGNLIGNVTDSIKLNNAKWNYYGNSFMAPMSTKALLAAIGDQPIDKTIYYWDNSAPQNYNWVNLGMFEGWDDETPLLQIPALGFFVVKHTNNEAGLFNIGYATTIYDYAIHPENYEAPMRQRQTNSDRVRIKINSESGVNDVVYLMANEQYSAEYDEGYDAEKLMNNGINLYVADETMNYAMLATDDILGAILSLKTNEDINYTLTFNSVRGEVYALRDNMTNTVVLMNEGATYNFTAQPNATLDGRFQIVSRQEMPTAVETVEENVNAPKAIYTIMGQYVGETTDWNTLPAGVYVVDGVKVIK